MDKIGIQHFTVIIITSLCQLKSSEVKSAKVSGHLTPIICCDCAVFRIHNDHLSSLPHDLVDKRIGTGFIPSTYFHLP